MGGNSADHSIVRYDNGGSGWVEFECGSCVVDVDFFDFDQVEVVEAARAAGAFQCPNCGATRGVQDLTAGESEEDG
jgi:hypothetical protein